MSKYGRRAAGTPLTDDERAELRALTLMPDSEIDFSDIPERVCGNWQGSVLPLEEHTVTLRVDAEVAQWLEHAGIEAAQEINFVLKRTAQRRGRLESAKAGLLQKAS